MILQLQSVPTHTLNLKLVPQLATQTATRQCATVRSFVFGSEVSDIAGYSCHGVQRNHPSRAVSKRLCPLRLWALRLQKVH